MSQSFEDSVLGSHVVVTDTNDIKKADECHDKLSEADEEKETVPNRIALVTTEEDVYYIGPECISQCSKLTGVNTPKSKFKFKMSRTESVFKVVQYMRLHACPGKSAEAAACDNALMQQNCINMSIVLRTAFELGVVSLVDLLRARMIQLLSETDDDKLAKFLGLNATKENAHSP